MKIEHKKLIAREILWGLIPFVCFVAFMVRMADIQGRMLWDEWSGWIFLFTVVISVYFVRAVVWAIKTLRKK